MAEQFRVALKSDAERAPVLFSYTGDIPKYILDTTGPWVVS
jgi:hypothetical protein